MSLNKERPACGGPFCVSLRYFSLHFMQGPYCIASVQRVEGLGHVAHAFGWIFH